MVLERCRTVRSDGHDATAPGAGAEVVDGAMVVAVGAMVVIGEAVVVVGYIHAGGPDELHKAAPGGNGHAKILDGFVWSCREQ